MCNFSLDGPRPLGDPSCCRRMGTARPPHSVFPPPALMSPFHYCAAIHHAHGQGDFAGTCMCVGDVAQAIITGDKAQGSALPGQGSGRHTCPGTVLLWLLSRPRPSARYETHLCISAPPPCLCPRRLRTGCWLLSWARLFPYPRRNMSVHDRPCHKRFL